MEILANKLPSTDEDSCEAIVSDPILAEKPLRLIDIETATGGLGQAFQAIVERAPDLIAEAEYRQSALRFTSGVEN